MKAMPTSQSADLQSLTRPGSLYEKCPDQKVRCFACGHRCLIAPRQAGVCRVRYNEAGELRVPWGYVGALQLDPIEKKPFFHALPGARALSFGMLGCDFHCGYCQNWQTSQVLRDPGATGQAKEIQPSQFVALAKDYGASVVTSTYNEPLITSEWAVAIFKEARAQGLVTSYVSNGNATPEVLEFLKPWVDLYKVDLKSFQDAHYRSLGGVLQNVLDSIQRIHRMGFWLEIVTLIIPGFNDSPEELRDIAQFLVAVSPDIPWHVTAFHPDYKMTANPNTGVKKLLEATEIGLSAGLRFVYPGNLPGQVGNHENTYCPGCRSLLIERCGFQVIRVLLKNGHCSHCHRALPGRWSLPADRPSGSDPTND